MASHLTPPAGAGTSNGKVKSKSKSKGKGKGKSKKSSSSEAKPFSIDTLLAQLTKGLKPGQTISIPLYKGETCTSTSVDGLTASRASRISDDANNGMAKAAAMAKLKEREIKFPMMAKFIETVSKPDFKNEFKDGFMIEEDIPKVKDDDESDEDSDDDLPTNNDSNNEKSNDPSSSNNNNPNNTNNPSPSQQQQQPRPPPPANKKRRWKRNQPPKRHWLILTKRETHQRFMYQRLIRQKQHGTANSDQIAKLENMLTMQKSSRYDGVKESNPSQYVLMAPCHTSPTTTTAAATSSTSATATPTPSIHVSPLHGFTSFTQPAKFHTLSMADAEAAITKQRNLMDKQNQGVRSRLLTKNDNASDAEDSKGGGGSGNVTSGSAGGKNDVTNKSKKRKRQTIDPDDIMSDITFSGTGIGGGRGGKNEFVASNGRREILSSLGDGDLTVDQDGILGGANDAEFGGKRRFGRLNVAKGGGGGGDDDDGVGGGGKAGGGGGGGGGAATNDGMAMDEDFYQRDVGAEYDEMDYDVNEQFDDDDVDIGAEEIDENLAGPEGDDGDDGDDFMTDDDDDDEDDQARAWKDMVKTDDDNIDGNIAGTNNASATTGPTSASPSDRKKVQFAASSDTSDNESISHQNVTKKPVDKKPVEKERPAASKTRGDVGVKEVDEHGNRIITKDSVHRELWLHSGKMLFSKLRKTFNAKSKERKDLLIGFLRELCISSKDDITGKPIVTLKQHYSKY